MLRKATRNDLDFIYELYMHPQVNPFLLYEQMDKSNFKTVFDDLINREILFVFEDSGMPAGMCKLLPLQFRNSHIIYLGGVAVHPFFADKGNGIKMMKEIIEYVKKNGFLRIELSVASINEKAIRLYEKAGFVKEGLLKKFTYLESESKFLDEVMMAYLI
jgi:ribosomal protein S18 acetylase RimI-like enzyme